MDSPLNDLEAMSSESLRIGEKLQGKGLKNSYEKKRGRVSDVQRKLVESISIIDFTFTVSPFLNKKLFNDKKDHLMHHVLSGSAPGYNNPSVGCFWGERDILADKIIDLLDKIADLHVADSNKMEDKTKLIMETIIMAVNKNNGKVDVSKIGDEESINLLKEWNELIQEAEENFSQGGGKSANERNKKETERVKKQAENKE